jgi:hypothetical protein
MNNIMFLYNNLVDSATLTASSAAAGYPVANLKNQLRTKCYKSAGATAGTANIVFDFGTPKPVTCIALTGYDWAAAPETLQVEFNDANSWGSPAEIKALTWAASLTANGNKASIILAFESINYRYARLNVINAAGDWKLGRIFIGEYFQPESNYLYGWAPELVDPSMLSQSVGGQTYADEIEKYRKVAFGLSFVTQAQWELFQKMANTAGISRDLFVAFDYENEPDEMTLYGKFTALPKATINRLNIAFSLAFRESV